MEIFLIVPDDWFVLPDRGNELKTLNRNLIDAMTAVIFCLAAFIPIRPVRAASTNVRTFAIEKEGAVVYDENGNGVADQSGDTWVYDTNEDGLAELIIQYQQAEALTAYIYDDATGDGRVDYEIGETGIRILEPEWRVKVTARDNRWIFPDGGADWNLDLVFDSGFSLVGSMAAIPRQTCWGKNQKAPVIALSDQSISPDGQQRKIDGIPDFSIRYWDFNNDGIPDLEWRNTNGVDMVDSMFVNLSSKWRIQTDHQFPLLGTVLFVDWQSARIADVRILIYTYLNNAGYNLITIHPSPAPGQPGYAFEDPFAYYSLLDNQACTPDLIIRLVSEAQDKNNPSLISYIESRYSWASSSEDIRYRLYLLGRVGSTDTVDYPPYPVGQISYQDLPSFVTSSMWQAASFAEYEGKASLPYYEGIYENLLYTPSLRNVILYNRKIILLDYFPVLLQLREEYNFTDFNRSPRLYFSPIDLRLHLVGARQGIIIFDAKTSQNDTGFNFTNEELSHGTITLYSWTSYADQDQDGYVDTWTHYENGLPTMQLVFRKGAALLSTQNSLAIKPLPDQLAASAWENTPPGSQTALQDFQNRMQGASQRHSLDDLGSIFKDLPGQAIELKNASLLSVSAQNKNLIAEISTPGLTLPPSLTGNPEGSQLPSGTYILSENEGSIQIDIPAQKELQLSTITADSPTEVARPGAVKFSVENPGLQDVDVRITVHDFSKGGMSVLFDKNTVIPARGQSEYDLSWLPASSGSHRIEVKLQYIPDNGAAPKTVIQDITLKDYLPDVLPQAFFPTGINWTAIAVALILAVLLVSSGTIFFSGSNIEDE